MILLRFTRFEESKAWKIYNSSENVAFVICIYESKSSGCIRAGSLSNIRVNYRDTGAFSRMNFKMRR